MVVALYNPKSAKRIAQLDEALELFRQHRPATTPVGLGIDLGSDDERIVLTDLASVPTDQVDMRTVVIIGNSMSRVLAGWFVTARGYRTT
jgi:precorrin-3B methylase